MASDPAPDPHDLGHRDRLRERFLTAGPDALADDELLEPVLFRSIPRRDVKPIAKALICRFGSFAKVVAAPWHLLIEVPGVGEAVAADRRIVAAAGQRLARGQVTKRAVPGSWTAAIDDCRAAMFFEDREPFRILFLDKKNALIADEVQQVGTVDHTPVYPREIVRRALELSSTAIVLVHNHPSGHPTPSQADITMTRKIIAVAKAMGIVVHDHIIVGSDGHASFKGLRLM